MLFKSLICVSLLWVCCLTPVRAQKPNPDSVLKVSADEIAPDFELKDYKGNRISLSQFRGKKIVVLAFYPFAFTQGCADELQSLQTQISTPDAALVGVSMDSIF